MAEGGPLTSQSVPEITPGLPRPAVPPSPTHHTLPSPLFSPIASDRNGPGPGSPRIRQAGPNPSPSGKRFPGISNNVRNNIYMKTLLNSPYHKSYTPLSATPGFSPAYTTPVRGGGQCGSPQLAPASPAPGPHPATTPQGTRPPGCKYVTPKNLVMNPFDHGVDHLHLPAYMSPGFFSVTSTPASADKGVFSWNIEHIAELNPAEIDEMPHHQHHHLHLDAETEERAQRAIEQFFASNLIVPSPWSDPQKPRNKPVLPATPANQAQHHEMMQELEGSIQKSLPPKQGMVDATCQTALSLPVNFDLAAVLGAYMTSDIEEGNQEMLSNSSLRRKLFFHGDTSSLAPSPVKGGHCGMDSAPGSPMFGKQPATWDHVTPLKNTPAFSSSPIKSGGTPVHRRCSSDPEFLASPELSPIMQGNLHKTSAMRSRSSGMFEVHQPDFDMSPLAGDEEDCPRGGTLSPIPFRGLSPVEGEEGRPKFEDSPGFSPICPPKTPIRKILRKSQEESYIQEELGDSDVEGESVTPVSAPPPGGHASSSLTPVIALSPIQVHLTTAVIAKAHSCTDLHTMMDFETGSNPRDNILTSSLCDTRDFTTSVDFRDDTQQHHSFSNQDTGYQTASLQSTNPESVSLHTNLTNQFGSLPFNLTNHESVLHNSSHLTSATEMPPVMNLAHHLSLISGDNEDLDFNTNNNGLSSPLFPTKQKLIFMDDDEDHDLQDTPKNQASSRQLFEDSALPDELDVRLMEVDCKLPEFDCVVTSQEKVVLSRARKTLAKANSLYPQAGCDVDSKQAFTKAKVSLEEKMDKEKLSASELAYSIIQRAGEDLAKYGSLIPTSKT